MKIKLLFAFLLVSFFAVAQPTNYQKIAARYRWIAGMFDSTLHIPSGVTPALRGGGWTGAGAIFFNTADSSLYTYTGYNWRKMGAYVDSLIYSTRAWRQKGDDSLGAVIAGIKTIYNANGTLTGDREFDGNGYNFESINFGGYTILANALNLESSDIYINSNIILRPDSIEIQPNLGNLIVDTLNYTLSTTGKKIMLRDTATGLVQNIDPALLVATPTLQQVLTEGSTLTTDNTIDADGNDFSIDNVGEFLQIRSSFNGTHSLYINGEIDLISTLADSSSNIDITHSVINIFPSSGNLKIDTLNHTLSLTGKKILLRDTATGLVQNIDPALLGGGSTNTSVGSGYKVAIDGTNNIKSLTGGYGITLDSATSNQVGIKADTATLFPAVRATIPAGSGWGLTGNSISYGSFLGTTSNNSLRFRTNNIERMVLDSSGTNLTTIKFPSIFTSISNGSLSFLYIDNSSTELKSANGLYLKTANTNNGISVLVNGATVFGGGNDGDVATAKVAINSTTRGLLIPRMTETQRNAISSPATGLQVHNTTDSSINVYRGTSGWYTADLSLTGSAALDFGSTSAQTSADLTITVTGAADGDVVSLGVPNGSANANTNYTAWVSAANTVTVRFNNYSSGAIDPASGTFKVRVIK